MIKRGTLKEEQNYQMTRYSVPIKAFVILTAANIEFDILSSSIEGKRPSSVLSFIMHNHKQITTIKISKISKIIENH